MTYYLGLDISTNCTGYTILDENSKLILCNFLDTSKEKDWFNKAENFKEFLINMPSKYKREIKHIAIEEILSKFSGGGSSSKTIIALARFNGLASYFCYEVFGFKPTHINVLRARSLAECKVPRGVNSKEYILKKVSDMYPEIVYPKMKTKDKLAKESYDMSDSVVIAKALLRQVNETTKGT